VFYVNNFVHKYKKERKEGGDRKKIKKVFKYNNTLTFSNILIKYAKRDSSPISASLSAYCIRYGYSYQIVLPITDPNQSDDLRCRWSSLCPTDECDGICDYIVTISNLTFSKSSAGYPCVINFNSALAAASSSGGEILKSIISFIKTFNKCLSLLCSRYNV
jgi:hypothetical protein